MKRYFDLTEEELLALSDAQVTRYIDYECALEGVPMLPPHPGNEPVRVKLTPDATAYKIAGVLTISSSHAAKILEAIQSAAIYESNYPSGDYNTKYLQLLPNSGYNYPKIETESIHSPEQWDNIKDSHAAQSIAYKEWQEISKCYNAAIKERASISDKVWETISEARTHSYQRDRLREEFTRYLDLAEGNRSIAYNFLAKAKDLAEFPELKAEFVVNEEC